jgi:hypothetical protein
MHLGVCRFNISHTAGVNNGVVEKVLATFFRDAPPPRD